MIKAKHEGNAGEPADTDSLMVVGEFLFFSVVYWYLLC